MRIEDFREVLKERIRIADECQDEWDYGIEQCWKKESEILTEDVQSTIEFLQNDCTPDEYSWVGEVLSDIVEKTGSFEIVKCYKSLMKKFPEECATYNIVGYIEDAEAIIKWREEHGENKS